MKLLKLKLEIDSIIIGERVKGGIYRPCLETIPATTVQGAFRHYLGKEVKGIGLFEKGTYEIRDFTYSVTDRLLQTAKMPFTTSCLYPANGDKVVATVYIVNPECIDGAQLNNLTLQLGALKSKGFGKSRIVQVDEIDSPIKQGLLNVRVLVCDARDFGIETIAPVYGYLFYPADLVTGVYKKALFENSLVKAPEVFLKEVTYYDEQEK